MGPGTSGSRSFWFVAYAVAMVMAGTNIATPLFSTYERLFKFTPLLLMLVFAIYIAMIVPGLLVFGSLADAVGRRPVLLLSVGAAIAGSALLFVANGLAWLLVARVLEGVSFAAAIGTGAAALVELQPRRDHGLAATVSTLAFLGGAALGPLMTGILAEYAPWPLRLTYAVHVVLLALGGLLLLGLPEPLPPRSRRRWRPVRPAVPSGRRGAFAFEAAAGAAAGTCGAVYLALSSSFAADLLRTDNLAIIGLVVTLFLAAGATAQLLLRRAPARASALGGLVGVGAGMAAGAVAVPVGSVALFAVGAVLAGAGQGVTFRGTLAMVLDLAPPQARADVTSAYYAAVYAAIGFTSLAFGLAAGWGNLHLLLPGFALLIGAVALASAAAMSRVRRSEPRRRSSG